MNYLAIDVGGTFTKYAVVTKKCEILHKDKFPTKKEKLEEFLDSLVSVWEHCGREYEIRGIGLSMPGLIDSKRGFMYTGGLIPCISNLNIAEIMEDRCHVPVTVENDAKCAALAELWDGALKDHKNAVVIICGTGVGGAVIQNGEIVDGDHCVAGELSYIMTDYDSEYDSRNCMAETTGIGSLTEYVSEETGILAKDLDGVKIFSMVNQGDERAAAGLRKYVRHIAVQIHNCRCMLDPEIFAIGGGISVQPLFLRMIREELERMYRVLPWKVQPPQVVTCRFFNDANLLGAVYVNMKEKERRQHDS